MFSNFKTECVLRDSTRDWGDEFGNQDAKNRSRGRGKKCRVKLNRRLRKDVEKSRTPKSSSRESPLEKNRTPNYSALPEESICRRLSKVWGANGLFLRNREPDCGIAKRVSVQQPVTLDGDKEDTSVQVIKEIWRAQDRKRRSNN